MRIIQHFLIPRLWSATCIEKKTSRVDEFHFFCHLVGSVHKIVIDGLCKVTVIS